MRAEAVESVVRSTVSSCNTTKTSSLDTHTGAFRYVIGGHPGPILVRRNEAPKIIDVPAFPIRIAPDAKFEECTLELAKGDRLYLHSDGINEEMNAEGEQFGRQRLAETLAACADKSLEESLDSVVDAIVARR